MAKNTIKKKAKPQKAEQPTEQSTEAVEQPTQPEAAKPIVRKRRRSQDSKLIF